MLERQKNGKASIKSNDKSGPNPKSRTPKAILSEICHVNDTQIYFASGPLYGTSNLKIDNSAISIKR